MTKKCLAVFLVLALHAAILWDSARRESATVDELSHLASGLYSLTTCDFRMNRVSPPLQNLICALPAYLAQDCQLTYDSYCWKMGIWNGSGDQLLKDNPDHFHQILMAGRTGTMFLSVILCFVIFLWSKELCGFLPAFFVLILAALEPNLLAHGHLATADTAPSLMFLTTGYLFWRFTRQPSRRRLLYVGIAFGFAWYSKQSGALLLPALFACFFIFSFFTQEKGNILFLEKWKGYRPIPQSLLHSAMLTGATAIIGFSILWAAYGCEIGDSIPGPRKPQFSYLWKDLQTPINTVSFLLRGHGVKSDGDNPDDPLWLFLRRHTPLFSHIEGFLSNRAHLRIGHRAYFMGEISTSGWRSYYPILFLIKTPMPLLLIFLAGMLLLALRAIRIDAMMASALFVIPAIYAYALIFMNTANIGYRHALPILPFLLVSMAGAAAAFAAQSFTASFAAFSLSDAARLPTKRERWLLGLFAIGLLAWSAADAFAIHPHHLAYFNQLIGGPRNGHYYAVDSNLDWGQDLLFLKRYIEKENLQDVHLLYFGPEKLPLAYKVPCALVDRSKPLPPGLCVVSASALHGIGAGDIYPHLLPFQNRKPDDYVTPSLLVYRIP
ncbi:MAG: glycosyltransferase family 39 protein [Candidatus Omnitrophota bacterium]